MLRVRWRFSRAGPGRARQHKSMDSDTYAMHERELGKVPRRARQLKGDSQSSTLQLSLIRQILS